MLYRACCNACKMAGASARFEALFRVAYAQRRSAIIGMVHLQALPGTPRHHLEVAELVENAVKEAKIYQEDGLDGVIVENMHDTPYIRGCVGPEITACMTRACTELRQALGRSFPLGVQVLAGANKEALAVAHAAGADFVRAEGYVFSQVGDEGWMDSCAGDLLRYRKAIGADDILVFTDIKKKHSSHAITSDICVSEMARTAGFFLSDGVIVTGQSTGCPANESELALVRTATSLPVLIGSGLTPENVHRYVCAHGLIVGSWFKQKGRWSNSVDRDRIASFMNKIHTLSMNH